jgi:anti-sigma28 factor (negative regulator of flagellin synthesis)
MRIDPENKIGGVYDASMRKTSQLQGNKENQTDGLKPDRVEISRMAKDELYGLKNQIVRDVEKGTSPDRLRRLKLMIDNGSYRVDSSSLAEAILGE